MIIKFIASPTATSWQEGVQPQGVQNWLSLKTESEMMIDLMISHSVNNDSLSH